MSNLPKIQSFAFWQRAIRLALLIWILGLAWNDLYFSISGLWDLFVKKTPLTEQNILSSGIIIFGILLIATVYTVYLYWFVHFILPITSSSQKWPAFKRILLHGISWGYWHGPAIFVHNGEVIGSSGEIKKQRPGIAFLDLRSAMALDKLHDEEEFGDVQRHKPKKVHFSLFDSEPYPAQIRVVGPGLTFTEKDEHITGTIDLRHQSRSRSKVSADTRDGIRISTSVFSSFTVGQLPDILDVCLGGENGRQVFVVEWDKESLTGTKKIKSLSRELDPEDEKEILNFIKINSNPATVNSMLPVERKPFTFDEKRAGQAIYSVTNVKDTGVKLWSDWPQDVAAEKFRILLSKKPLMNLYTPEEPLSHPMKKFRREVFVAVRNTGVLAYRVVKQQENTELKEGVVYMEKELIFYPPQNLTRSDVLRDRGIKVTGVGFGDLEPKDQNVRKWLKESWVSSRQKEKTLRNADYTLQADRIINRARVRAQQSMNYHLAKLLEKQEYPREALAILVFQELEAAAADPETRRLLPENTLSMLSNISQLLLPSQKDSENDGSKNLFTQVDDL